MHIFSTELLQVYLTRVSDSNLNLLHMHMYQHTLCISLWYHYALQVDRDKLYAGILSVMFCRNVE
jgi:hypothetical protein